MPANLYSRLLARPEAYSGPSGWGGISEESLLADRRMLAEYVLGWLDSVAAVVGADGDLALFELSSGQVVKRLDVGERLLPGVVTSDSKTLAMPSPESGEIVLFDMRGRELLGRIKPLPRDIGPISLAVSNNICH